tara:strand:- start:893 stop:1315 length:423 start_codon:yes stop_codon:yes gene_type:complete
MNDTPTNDTTLAITGSIVFTTAGIVRSRDGGFSTTVRLVVGSDFTVATVHKTVNVRSYSTYAEECADALFAATESPTTHVTLETANYADGTNLTISEKNFATGVTRTIDINGDDEGHMEDVVEQFTLLRDAIAQVNANVK